MSKVQFDQAFQDSYSELIGYACKYVKNKQNAQDIVHDAYLRLRKVENWDTIENSRAFIYRATRNLMIDRLRRFSKQVSSDAESQGDVLELNLPNKRSPLEETLGSEKQKIIQEKISSLPEKCQEVFILHKFSGLKHSEIAEHLNISKSTVEKHVINALRQCRAALREYHKN